MPDSGSPKAPRIKGMTTDQASLKKIAGRVNEHDYAGLIGGEVNEHDITSKKDVFDRQHRVHSVKSGKKWQMFLYSKGRLESNTVLRGLGRVSEWMIDCIQSQPSTFNLRETAKEASKLALQPAMRGLAEELQKSDILPAFIKKAAFEDSQVDFIAILDPSIDQTKAPIEVFEAQEVVEVMRSALEVTTSKKRGRNQTDAQKVIFRTSRNIGEIELRIDPTNYLRMKMWWDAERVLNLLREKIPETGRPHRQVIVHGKANRLKIG